AEFQSGKYCTCVVVKSSMAGRYDEDDKSLRRISVLCHRLMSAPIRLVMADFQLGVACGFSVGFGLGAFSIWATSCWMRSVIASICLRIMGIMDCVASDIMAGISFSIFWPVGAE